MKNYLLEIALQLIFGWPTMRIIQKYLPRRDGKFLDQEGYVLIFGQGMLIVGLVQNHGWSFIIGFFMCLTSIMALIKKYLTNKKARI